MAATTATVRGLRVVLTAADFDEAVRLYRDVLGMPERGAVGSPGGRVVILEAGRATLEIADPGHAAYIDDVEVGRRTAGPVRIALEVDDVEAGVQQIVGSGGAELVADATTTPWGSRNARFDAPGGVQLTLFGP